MTVSEKNYSVNVTLLNIVEAKRHTFSLGMTHVA